MTETAKLLPCPFCGDRDPAVMEHQNGAIDCIACFRCNARFSAEGTLHPAPTWNRRAPVDEKRPREMTDREWSDWTIEKAIAAARNDAWAKLDIAVSGAVAAVKAAHAERDELRREMERLKNPLMVVKYPPTEREKAEVEHLYGKPGDPLPDGVMVEPASQPEPTTEEG